MFASTIVAFALLAGVQAHFTLDYPKSRGFVDDDEGKFCDGFNDPSAQRSDFPLNNGLIVVDNHHDEGVVLVSLSVDAAPAGFDSFNATKNAGKGATVLDFFKIEGAGVHCFATPDLSKLGVDLKDGTPATLQVTVGGHSTLYQCADVVIKSAATAPASGDLKCPSVLPVGAGASPSASQTSTASGASSTPTKQGGAASTLQLPALLLTIAAVAGVAAL